MAPATQIRIARGSRSAIEIEVGGHVEIQLSPRELPALELGDINFGLGRSVLVPPLSDEELARTSGKSDAVAPAAAARDDDAPHAASSTPEWRALMAEAVFARAFHFVRDNPDKLLCVAGHTDASGSSSGNDALSEKRALSVALYLRAGAREAWAKHSFENAKPEDYQQALTFVHLVRGYYCNPRGIDGQFGAGSKRALRNFKTAYNADFQGHLTVDDTRREEDWLAFYDIYDSVLGMTLGMRREELAAERERFVFSEPAVLGCGERFPLGDAEDPDAPPAQYAPRDRRVDLLFLDADDRVDLKKQPPGQAIYGQGSYVLTSLPPAHFPPRPARPVIEVLELSDGCFDAGHRVLMPTRVPGIDAPGISATHTFKKLFATLEACGWQRILCLCGHTDTQGSEGDNDSLSADRAENVLHYLRGDRDGWARHSFGFQKDADYQRILQWISLARGWKDVDPGEVDGKFGKKSKTALQAFRKRWNQSLAQGAGFGLDEAADRFEGDFRAFYVLYDRALQDELGVDEQGLAMHRANLAFGAPAAIGCGERWTAPAIGEDDHPSGRNRRVDLLLLDPSQPLPELYAVPPGLVPYGLGRYELRYINQKIRVPVLDLADTNFRTNRSVLVPSPEPAPDAKAKAQPQKAEQAAPSFEQGFADLFNVLERFPKKRVLVAGHTDSVGSDKANDTLSADRAESVLFYVSGKKSAWVDHAQKHAAPEDYQQALAWVHSVKPHYGCDPGTIDNDFGRNSKRALVAFKKGVNKEHGKKLPEDDTRRKDDWAAFYDVYDDVIAAKLGLEGSFAERQKALDERRKKIVFTDRAAIGCGERYTIEKAGEDAVPSKRNRRVDVLLFDEGELPEIATDPPGEALYAMGRFAMVGVESVLQPVLIMQPVYMRVVRDTSALDAPNGKPVGQLPANTLVCVLREKSENATCFVEFEIVRPSDDPTGHDLVELPARARNWARIDGPLGLDLQYASARGDAFGEPLRDDLMTNPEGALDHV